MYFHKDSELFLYLRDMKENVPVIYAAPLQGFTEVAWRNAHAQCLGGVDAYYTPFVRLEKGEIRNKDRRDVSPEENTVPRLVPQVIASDPEELKVLTDFLASQGYREIDVNMGCPFPLIVRRGKGAGILSSPEKVEALLEMMKAFPEIRFSVKMRLGGQDAEEWKALVPLLNRSCVTQVTLHSRIGKQQYKGMVDREAFRAFYEACERPLAYNGDLLTVADIREVLEAFPRLKGVMLGRGLLANPALALAFREGELSENELKARVAQMHRQMYLYYHRVIEGGEAQLLAKLKTCWEYLLPELDKKQRKAILKSNRLDGYLRAVEEALR